ncbi:hypothetical protein, partial [Rhizobium leguminosarum]|uniref:hypothetical protein n=1 Tax=Rhizobium leguminosarum TaxID=384 RepID=UPI003F9CDD5F
GASVFHPPPQEALQRQERIKGSYKGAGRRMRGKSRGTTLIKRCKQRAAASPARRRYAVGFYNAGWIGWQTLLVARHDRSVDL